MKVELAVFEISQNAYYGSLQQKVLIEETLDKIRKEFRSKPKELTRE